MQKVLPISYKDCKNVFISTQPNKPLLFNEVNRAMKGFQVNAIFKTGGEGSISISQAPKALRDRLTEMGITFQQIA